MLITPRKSEHQAASPPFSPPSSASGVAAINTAFDQMLDGVLLCDENGLIQYANSRAAAIFGYSPAELIGAPVSSLLSESVHVASDAPSGAGVVEATDVPNGSSRRV